MQKALASVRRQISTLIDQNAPAQAVLGCLSEEDQFVPVECELWDYKRDAPIDAAGRSELIKDIASFHNSYGGYLILGVTDPSSTQHAMPIGISSGEFDIAALRSQVAAAVSSRIDVGYAEHVISTPSGSFVMGLLHIPKRAQGQPPVTFTRNGADKSPKNPVFRVGTVPMRVLDASQIAVTKDDFAFLLSNRLLVLSSEDSSRIARSAAETVPLSNNLPDRNLICPRFVGRESIVAALWRWLADPFIFVRVLAGDGGKGKTSIAYQFASEVAGDRVAGLEQVIWLSAKQRQFYGLDGEYRSLPKHEYEDAASLIKAICRHCGLSEDEVNDVPIETLRILAAQALETLPALVVIDDVDSCEPNEQKRILELAVQISSRRSRFLLTTRANVSYSSDLAIQVPGIPRPEYDALVNTLLERLKVLDVKKGDYERLHHATDGSPLLTESILRLVRLGMSVTAAIQDWRGHAGRDARSAALQKEVDRLAPESRRTLLAIALLQECSRSELRQLTAYPDLRLSDSIEELQSLFLIGAPRITADEPRFSMSDITRSLVLDQRAKLAPDFAKLSQNAAQLRKRGVGGASGAWVVGAAINQAHAQLQAQDPASAIRTLAAALEQHSNHKDLLSMLGRAYLAMNPPRLNEARDHFRASYEHGCRRPELLRDWYEAEVLAGNPSAALEVCGFALSKDADDITWIRQRAYAGAMLGEARRKVGDAEGALQALEEAANDLSKAIAAAKGPRKHEYKLDSVGLHDKIIQIARHSSAHDPYSVFNCAWNALMRGDFRRSVYWQLLGSLADAVGSESRIVIGSRIDQSISVYLQKAEDSLSRRPQFDGDHFREEFLDKLRSIEGDYRKRRYGA